MEQELLFVAGKNIALKIPSAQYQRTVKFYAEVMGFPTERIDQNSAKVQFGTITLWLDCVSSLTVAETWLEVRTTDTRAAEMAFGRAGIERCETIESLPENYDGFWVRSPTGQVVLTSGPKSGN